MMPLKTSKFRVTLIAATLGLSVLAGCATKPDPSDTAAVEAYNEANDPLEPMNRYFFEVNQFLDEVLLKPFDMVVVQGVSHGWSNRGTEPCLLFGFLLDAQPRT